MKPSSVPPTSHRISIGRFAAAGLLLATLGVHGSAALGLYFLRVNAGGTSLETKLIRFQ